VLATRQRPTLARAFENAVERAACGLLESVRMRSVAKRLSIVLCATLCASFLPTGVFARSAECEATWSDGDDADDAENSLAPWLPGATSPSLSDEPSSMDATGGLAKRKRRPRPKKARKPRIKKRRHAA
jgi:hypothetical protein